MQTTLENINVKVDASDKSDFVANTRNLGTNPSNAIRMFIRAFNERQGFPFDTSAPYKKCASADAVYDEMKNEASRGEAKVYNSFDEVLGDL